MKQSYFDYLDALRCLAFLGVFYAHTGTIFANATIVQAFPLNIWTKFTVYGSYGVNFFFVLSGFLITYLLLREKEKSGTIEIKKFYLKRILRIWPVYFLTLLGAAFILPFIISSETYTAFTMANPHISNAAFFYNFFFLGNFYQGMSIGMASLSIGILWSVCVEEQFYLVWPWIVKWFNARALTFFVAFLISLSLLYKFVWAEDRMANYYLPWSLAMDLGFGAMLGIAYYFKRMRTFIKSMIAVFVVSITLVGIIYVMNKPALIEILRLVKTLIIDSVFALVILFFLDKKADLESTKPISGFISVGNKSKKKILAFLMHLGRISYGLYAYHTICLMLVVHILFSFGLLDQQVSRTEFFTVIISAFILTICAAELSYKYMEKQILAFKARLNK